MIERPPQLGLTLFHPEELQLKQTGQARWRSLARRPVRRPTRHEQRCDEDEAMLRKLQSWGAELAGIFGLNYRSLNREREGVLGHYGICYEDGSIRIRLRHAKTDRLLKESSLVDTLCHELAHLKYLDHSVRFRRFYRRILDRARELGYYRPGPVGRQRPTQLSLFNSDRA